MEEVLTRLLSSAGAAPMNRTVKIHSMESNTVTPICFRFQVNKCPFGDKCKYRHIKMITLYQETIKKIKTITVLIRKKSHPKYQTENLQPIIIIIVLLVLQQENHLMDMRHHTQQCRLEP